MAATHHPGTAPLPASAPLAAEDPGPSGSLAWGRLRRCTAGKQRDGRSRRGLTDGPSQESPRRKEHAPPTPTLVHFLNSVRQSQGSHCCRHGPTSIRRNIPTAGDSQAGQSWSLFGSSLGREGGREEEEAPAQDPTQGPAHPRCTARPGPRPVGSPTGAAAQGLPASRAGQAMRRARQAWKGLAPTDRRLKRWRRARQPSARHRSVCQGQWRGAPAPIGPAELKPSEDLAGRQTGRHRGRGSSWEQGLPCPALPKTLPAPAGALQPQLRLLLCAPKGRGTAASALGSPGKGPGRQGSQGAPRQAERHAGLRGQPGRRCARPLNGTAWDGFLQPRRVRGGSPLNGSLEGRTAHQPLAGSPAPAVPTKYAGRLCNPGAPLLSCG